MSEPSNDLSINDIADDFEDQVDEEESINDSMEKDTMENDEQRNKENNDQNSSQSNQERQDFDPQQFQQNSVFDIELSDIPDDKRAAWIDEMLFKDKVTDTREIAGGNIELEMQISTGQSDVEVFETVRSYIEDIEDKDMGNYTDSELNTMISISHCAHSVQVINGEKPGGDDIMKKFQWFHSKPIPLINRILKEYQKFEYEITLVLDQGEDIKK